MPSISGYLSMIAYLVQIAFWLVVGFSAIWAAATFRRYVNFMTSEDAYADSDQLASGDEPTVDEFVE
jgi:hypothetical protein